MVFVFVKATARWVSPTPFSPQKAPKRGLTKTQPSHGNVTNVELKYSIQMIAQIMSSQSHWLGNSISALDPSQITKVT